MRIHQPMTKGDMGAYVAPWFGCTLPKDEQKPCGKIGGVHHVCNACIPTVSFSLCRIPDGGGLVPNVGVLFWSGACSPRRSVFPLGGLSAKMKRLSGGGCVPQNEASFRSGCLCAKMKRLFGGGRVPQDAFIFIDLTKDTS